MKNNEIRNAFIMRLKPGFQNEYKLRHSKIWPDLQVLLAENGISDYSIFLDEKTGTLFAVQKLRSDTDLSDLPNQPLMKKWWEYMSDIMETNGDNSPKTEFLKEVFRME